MTASGVCESAVRARSPRTAHGATLGIRECLRPVAREASRALLDVVGALLGHARLTTTAHVHAESHRVAKETKKQWKPLGVTGRRAGGDQARS